MRTLSFVTMLSDSLIRLAEVKHRREERETVLVDRQRLRLILAGLIVVWPVAWILLGLPTGLAQLAADGYVRLTESM